MALKNNKGQTIFFTFMLAISVAILAMALTPVVKTFVDNARAPSSDTAIGLDCSNSSISDFDKANCVAIDLQTPYFFWGILGLVGVIISAKLLIGEQ